MNALSVIRDDGTSNTSKERKHCRVRHLVIAPLVTVLAVCGAPRLAAAAILGTVETPVTIEGSSGASIDFSIYLPPGYEPNGSVRYPVVYHLHGLGGSHTGGVNPAAGIGQLNVVPTSHEGAVASGVADPVIIVFPDGYGDSFWADSFDGQKPAESDVVDAIIPYVDSHYLTQGRRGRRIVQGFSMGGFGAAKFAAKFPDMFAASVVYDGALLNWNQFHNRHEPLATSIFNDSSSYFDEFSPWYWVTQNAQVLQASVPYRQAVGALDTWNQIFRAHLLVNGITSSYIDTPAEHDLSDILDSFEPANSSTTVSEASWAFIQNVFDANATTTSSFVSVAADDGWIGEVSENSGLGGALNAIAPNLLVGDNASRQQLRSVLSFDTSSIPDTANILSARLVIARVGGAGSTSTLGTLRADVQSGTFGTAALANTDFQSTATASPGITSISIPANGQATSTTLNASGLLAVNRTGHTQIRLGFSSDDDNDPFADNIAFASGNHSNTGLRPVLEVTFQ